MARIIFSAVVASLCLCSAFALIIPIPTTLSPSLLTSGGYGSGISSGGNEVQYSFSYKTAILDSLSAALRDLFDKLMTWFQSTLNNATVQGTAGYADFVNSMNAASNTFQTRANQTAGQTVAQLSQGITQLQSALNSGYELLGRLCAEQQTQAAAGLQTVLAQLETTLALARTARSAILYNCTTSGGTSTSSTGSCTGVITGGVGSSDPLNVSQTINSSQLTDALNQANKLYNDSATFIATNANNAAVTGNTNFQSLVNNLANAKDALQNQTLATGAQATAALNQVQSSLMAAEVDATKLASDLAAQGQTAASIQAQNLANQIQTTLTTVQTAQGSLANSGGLSIDGSGISTAFTYAGSVSISTANSLG